MNDSPKMKELIHQERILSFEIGELQRKLAKLRTDIKKISSKQGLHVTDHAIIRFLQRVQGLDISYVEQLIVTQGLLDALKVAGTGCLIYPQDGYQIVVENYSVKTIIK